MQRHSEWLAELGGSLVQEFPCGLDPDDRFIVTFSEYGGHVRLYIETPLGSSEVEYDLSIGIHLNDETIDDLITTLQYIKYVRKARL